MANQGDGQAAHEGNTTFAVAIESLGLAVVPHVGGLNYQRLGLL
jgi:hypothetical protein